MKNQKRPDEVLLIASMIIVMFVVLSVQADEMVHKFKSPSFSGEGTSSHYLTIENQETNRAQAIKDEIAALAEKLERDKTNTVEARL